MLHPDTSSRKRRVEPGQSTSTPTKYPAPRWLPHLCSSLPSLAPHSSADQGPGILPETQGQIQPWPCLGAGTWGKAGDGNANEQRQSPEEEMCPAHTAHGNLHEHLENTREAPAVTRRDRSGSRRLGSALPLPALREPSTAGGGSQPPAPRSCLRCCAPERAHIAPRSRGPLVPGVLWMPCRGDIACRKSQE